MNSSANTQADVDKMLDSVNEQHLMSIADEMGRQHHNADCDQHQSVLFSVFPGFLPFYQQCLAASAATQSPKYFALQPHRSLILVQYLKHCLKHFSVGHWADCGALDGLSSRLICETIKQNNREFLGEGYYFIEVPPSLEVFKDEDMIITIDTASKNLLRSIGDNQAQSTDADPITASYSRDESFVQDFPQAKVLQGKSQVLPDIPWSFVHINVRSFTNAAPIIDFFYPRLCRNGVILLSNYADPYYPGPKKAWSRYFDRNNLPYAILDTGLAALVKA